MTGPRPIRRLLQRLLVAALLLALVTAAACLAWVRADRFLRNDLLQQARVAAMAINPYRAWELSGTPDDAGRGHYHWVKKQLAAIRSANPQLRFLYLMTRRPDGAVVFLVDNEPADSPDLSPPGQVFSEVSPAFAAAIRDGHDLVEGPVRDRWGNWVSAMVHLPRPSPETRPVVLGLDVDATHWHRNVAIHAAPPAMLAVITAILALIVFLIARSRRRLRHQQAELRQSENRYRELAEQAQIIAWEIDTAGRYTFVGPAVEPLLGYRPEELVGRMHFYDLHPAEGRDAFKQLAFGVFARQERFLNVENPMQARDGQVRWVTTSGLPVRDHDGQLLGYRGTDMDITESMKARDALQASEQEKQAILDHLPVVGVLLDLDLRILWANQAAGDSVGKPPADLTGMRCHELWGRPDEPCPDCPARRAQQSGSREDGRIECPDGRIWNTRSVPLRDEHGTLYATFQSAEDITERTRAEERMQELLEDSTRARQALLGILEDHERAAAELKRLATAIDQSADTVVITEADGAILYVNPAFEAVTGYTREEAVGRNPRILKSGRQDEAFYRDMWAVLARGDTWRGRFVNRRKDGTEYTEDAVVSPVRNAAGDVVNYVAVKHDITQQLRLEEQLRQNQKIDSIGRLAGGVAHDFNNMLTVILGQAELTLADEALSGTVRASLEEIRHAANNSAAITRQLLAFARKQPVSPRILDLNETVGNATRMLTRLIGEQIPLDWRPAATVWPVRADPAQIDQILVNLCVNARDAVHENGRIEISTANVPAADIPANALFPGHEGDCVRLTVRDNGAGMEPEQVEHIFEPFYTTKPSGQGTGLGLPMVYGIIRQNGGFIDVESAPGRGTDIHVFLPRHETGTESAAEPRPEVTAPPAAARQTILLVEDEPSVLAIVAEWLDALGYHVRSAVSPAEAIRLAREIKEPIDLLLTDVIMPGMNGRDLAQTLRTLQPGLRVLFMSGYSSDIVSGHGILDEDAAFIPKPFDQDAFVAKVRQVLAEPGAG